MGIPVPLRGGVLACATFMVLLCACPRAEAASTVNREIEPSLSARISNGKNIYLVVQAAQEYEQRAAADRVMNEPEPHRRHGPVPQGWPES